MSSLFLSKIEQIEKALELGLDYPALALALSIPDVCSSIEFNDSGRETYRRWYQKHVIADEDIERKENELFDRLGVEPDRRFRIYLRSWDVYNLRCVFLHSGRGDVYNFRGDSNYASFKLTTGDEDYSELASSLGSSSRGPTNTSMVANIGAICRPICEGARRFYEGFDRKDLLDDCNIKVQSQ